MSLATVASPPVGSHIWISPRLAIGRFRPGMELCFVAPTGNRRVGTATIEGVDYVSGELHFTSNLNALVCAVIEGDEIHEYEVPCTRCRCKRCGGGG